MSQETPAAPLATSRNPLSTPSPVYIPRNLCQLFRKDATFQQLQFGCQKMFYARDIAEREHNIPISINALVRAFDCPRSSVQSALAHGLKPPEERVKHTALEANREQQILDWIQQKAEQSIPVSKTEIKDDCTGQLKV